MKTILKITMLLFLSVFLISGTAFTAAFNDRPIQENDDLLPGHDLSFLQTELDNITVGGPGIDVVNDQSSSALFTNDASGGSVATMIVEIAGFANFNQFGIYDAADSTNKALVFDGPDSPGALNGGQATIAFLLGGIILVDSSVAATGFSENFGFYLDIYSASVAQGGDGDNATLDYTVFSEDDLNNGGLAQAIIYQGDNQTQLQIQDFQSGLFSDSEWIIAFEDLLRDFNGNNVSDEDFTDFVVLVESISAVPEPATMLLSGLGLLGIGAYLRRRFKKA